MRLDYRDADQTVVFDGAGTVLLSENAVGLSFNGWRDRRLEICNHTVVTVRGLTLRERIGVSVALLVWLWRRSSSRPHFGRSLADYVSRSVDLTSINRTETAEFTTVDLPT